MPLALLFATFVGLNPSVLTVPIVPYTDTYSVAELQAIATSSAAKYHLTKKQTVRMMKTIECESNWSATATSSTGDIGVIQMNKRSHPEFSEEQMFDPYFSLDWMAKQFSLKHYSLWVCYTLLFG